MPLASGSRLGPYEITGAIGAGGMGQVYKARDTKLNRDVAVKVLSDAFAADLDRLARFEREAQTLAALNHPNIAQIHGIIEAPFGADSSITALVMEFVDGEDLAHRLARGPIPLDEALAIAAQMIDALDAAHEAGIIHRDLKPANIKIRDDGTLKLLDFGLAKVQVPAGIARELSPSAEMNSPTVTGVGTQLGMLMGTAAYMAPEQARGKAVDRRADIWAFGAVLYEMVTGRACFARDTSSDTLAAVLAQEPDWQRVPPEVLPLLRRCLDKDPKRRLRDIGDARLLLEQAPRERAAAPKTRIPWAVAALMACALAIAVVMLWPRSVDRPLVRLDVDLGREIPPRAFGVLAFSPDGSRLVFPVRGPDGRAVLATRLVDQAEIVLLEGTEGGDQPFFSPDGQWIGFFADDKLKKVPVRGGRPVTLCDAQNPRGASWGEDGTIIAALVNTTGLSRVSAEGGAPEPLTKLEEQDPTHRWPQILPGNKAVIFTARSASLNSYEDAAIDVQSLENGTRKTLLRGGYFGRFIPGNATRGHLVYVHRGVLYAVAFDTGRLQIEGEPTAIVHDIASDPGYAAGRFEYSRTGLLAYRRGTGVHSWPVVWLDSAGKIEPLIARPSLHYSPRFSPDGQWLALSTDSGSGSDIFIYDLARDTMSRLTFTGESNADPVWAPDGAHLAFRSRAGESWPLWWIRADGAGGPHLLAKGEKVEDVSANAFSPDGRRLIYTRVDPVTRSDLWTLPLDVSDLDRPKPGTPEPFLRTPFAEERPAFSSDGRWVAYTSNESGTIEVYVRPFPAPASGSSGRYQVSTGGGYLPVWSRNGRELFYQSPDNRVMVVEYKAAGDSFTASKPRRWSDRRLLVAGFTNFDLAPDGQRFAILPAPESAESSAPPRVTFLLNFLDELRRRVPRRN